MTRELAVHYPHEMCLLHRLIIIIFSGPTCALVSHNAYLLRQFWPAHSYLALWCGLRISFCVVRPYLWWHVLRVYGAARREPTPALVAQALIAAQDEPLVLLNARLGFGFICWLSCSTAFLLARGWLQPEGRSEAEEALWAHCKLNFWSLVVQKLISVALFFYLISSDGVARNLAPETLEAYSTLTTLTDEDVREAGTALISSAQARPGARRTLCSTECIICQRDFAAGERVRWLRCPHAFHTECIDEWALRHKNQCPLCQARIGPPEPSLAELLGERALAPGGGVHEHVD